MECGHYKQACGTRIGNEIIYSTIGIMALFIICTLRQVLKRILPVFAQNNKSNGKQEQAKDLAEHRRQYRGILRTCSVEYNLLFRWNGMRKWKKMRYADVKGETKYKDF